LIFGFLLGMSRSMSGLFFPPRILFQRPVRLCRLIPRGPRAPGKLLGAVSCLAGSGRDSGWPKFFGSDARPRPAAQKAVSYFDMVHFASRIKAPGFYTVGFPDTTCPPATVYAAYNQLGRKTIFHAVAAARVTTPLAKQIMRIAVLDRVAKQREP
jgi:hypothetical protein